MMEGRHLFTRSFLAVKHPHALGQAVVGDQTVRHFDPFGLHRVVLPEMVLSDRLVVQVGNLILVHSIQRQIIYKK